MENLIIVLSGPSGAGKGTIYDSISKNRKNVYRYVSYTTRSRRPSEFEGVDYNYVSFEEFKKKQNENFFLETIFYNGNYYGTPIPNFEEHSEVDIFFDLNAKGGLKIKECFPEAILIYIMPKDIKELERRMSDRGLERIEFAKQEVELAKKFDWLIVNDNLSAAVSKIESILNIYKESRMLNKKNQDFLDNFY